MTEYEKSSEFSEIDEIKVTRRLRGPRRLQLTFLSGGRLVGTNTVDVIDFSAPTYGVYSSQEGLFIDISIRPPNPMSFWIAKSDDSIPKFIACDVGSVHKYIEV